MIRWTATSLALPVFLIFAGAPNRGIAAKLSPDDLADACKEATTKLQVQKRTDLKNARRVAGGFETLEFAPNADDIWKTYKIYALRVKSDIEAGIDVVGIIEKSQNVADAEVPRIITICQGGAPYLASTGNLADIEFKGAQGSISVRFRLNRNDKKDEKHEEYLKHDHSGYINHTKWLANPEDSIWISDAFANDTSPKPPAPLDPKKTCVKNIKLTANDLSFTFDECATPGQSYEYAIRLQQTDEAEAKVDITIDPLIINRP